MHLAPCEIKNKTENKKEEEEKKRKRITTTKEFKNNKPCVCVSNKRAIYDLENNHCLSLFHHNYPLSTVTESAY